MLSGNSLNVNNGGVCVECQHSYPTLYLVTVIIIIGLVVHILFCYTKI